MVSVLWFLGGSVSAMAGVFVLAKLGFWGSWIGSLLGGALVVAFSRRVATLAGASSTAAIVGSLVATSIAGSVLLAMASVAVIGAGMFLRTGWEATLRGRSRGVSDDAAGGSSRAHGSTDDRADVADSVEEPSRPSNVSVASHPLKPRDIAALLRLAEEDTTVFRKRLQELTPQQRDQIRSALRVRKENPAALR